MTLAAPDATTLDVTRILLVVAVVTGLVLRAVRLLTAQRADETLACPKTGRTVHCVVLRSPSSGACVGVERCSGDNPECTRSCVPLLARGVPLVARNRDGGPREPPGRDT